MKELTQFSKRFRFTFIVAVLTLSALAIEMSHAPSMAAQAILVQPNVFQSTTFVAGWTAGTVNNGGHAVTIVAGTGAVTTNASPSCAAPGYTACNFVFSNSSGTVSITTSVPTAFASGNILMAYIEAGGTGITNLTFPLQASTVGQLRAIVNCGTTSTCTGTPAGAGLIEVYGSAPLVSGSPSQVTISSLPFTTTTYICVATPQGSTAAIAAGGAAVTVNASTNFTITGPNTVLTVVNYRCSGN